MRGTPGRLAARSAASPPTEGSQDAAVPQPATANAGCSPNAEVIPTQAKDAAAQQPTTSPWPKQVCGSSAIASSGGSAKRPLDPSSDGEILMVASHVANEVGAQVGVRVSEERAQGGAAKGAAHVAAGAAHVGASEVQLETASEEAQL